MNLRSGLGQIIQIAKLGTKSTQEFNVDKIVCEFKEFERSNTYIVHVHIFSMCARFALYKLFVSHRESFCSCEMYVS